ncbi:MAG: class I SAM-dependent methyltransferase [Ilumatobacteraceae bacterium]|nr:class I SAM-dependent methyltransferase [Ilumatobacteraceae bacterium]
MAANTSDRPVPNHHASHGGFSGVSGLLAAFRFLSGRDEAARLAIELAELAPGDRLVDIGCGPGTAVHAADELGAEVVGVDPASVMLRVARLRWLRDGSTSWRVGTAESVPVADGWANAVWSLATVHHWVDLEAGIREVHRVLAPRGRFVAMERRIDDPDADGVASHGWTVEQAESFSEHLRRHGFVDLATGTHDGTPELVHVVARRA